MDSDDGLGYLAVATVSAVCLIILVSLKFPNYRFFAGLVLFVDAITPIVQKINESVEGIALIYGGR